MESLVSKLEYVYIILEIQKGHTCLKLRIGLNELEKSPNCRSNLLNWVIIYITQWGVYNSVYFCTGGGGRWNKKVPGEWRPIKLWNMKTNSGNILCICWCYKATKFRKSGARSSTSFCTPIFKRLIIRLSWEWSKEI